MARNNFQTINVYGHKAPEAYIKEKKRILKDTIFLEKQLDTTLTHLAECRDTVSSIPSSVSQRTLTSELTRYLLLACD